MPYIKPGRRGRLDKGALPLDVGDLNYSITRLCQEYLAVTPRTYADYNAVMGVLECAKLELYRRQVAGHEDDKCESNGDVYR